MRADRIQRAPPDDLRLANALLEFSSLILRKMYHELRCEDWSRYPDKEIPDLTRTMPISVVPVEHHSLSVAKERSRTTLRVPA